MFVVAAEYNGAYEQGVGARDSQAARGEGSNRALPQQNRLREVRLIYAPDVSLRLSLII